MTEYVENKFLSEKPEWLSTLVLKDIIWGINKI